MKRFAKLLSLRLDKIYIAALIITALQLLIGVIVNTTTLNENLYSYGMFAIIADARVITPSSYSTIIAVVASILIAVMVMHYNNPRYYLHLCIKKSQNVSLSFFNALIMSIWVAATYIISNVISTALIMIVHNDYAIINSVFESFNYLHILKNILIVFLACNSLCAVAMGMRLLYDKTKTVAILLSGLCILVVALMLFANILPEKATNYIYSYGGSATILTCIYVTAFGGYALGEMLGEVKR